MLTLLLAAVAAPPPKPRPALVVSIVVDQLRPDYLDRWRAQFTGGFRQLLAGGTYFPAGLQDHAVTETAPGHASVLSGRFPRSTGIVTNERGVPDARYPLVGAAGPGASPDRFRGTALYDWMRAADGATRVLSVSRKDRGAILPVGRGGRDVYWLRRGTAVTSRWYADSLPAWVREWNARGAAAALAGRTWTPLLPDSAYAESDAFPFEAEGKTPFFPHRLPATAAGAAEELERFPWADSLTLDLALDGVRRTGLGRRGAPDLLNVSLSTTDAVGHAYGPDSRELHDQVLRVDRWLGHFLDSLRVLVPGPIAVVLTADHGVQPMPAFARAMHRDAGAVSVAPVLRALRAQLAARHGTRDFGLDFDGGLLFADTAALRAAGESLPALADSARRALLALDGVAAAWTPATLARGDGPERWAARWRRSLAPGSPWLAAAVPTEGWIWGSAEGYATHGTPHPLDAGVPVLLALPGAAPRRVTRPVRTVDIAPTLAAWLGIRPLEPLDGRVLREALPPRR